jgi:hypothetical protein
VDCAEELESRYHSISRDSGDLDRTCLFPEKEGVGIERYD